MPTIKTIPPLPPMTSAICGIIQSAAEDNLAGYAVLDMSHTLIENWKKHENDTPDSDIPQSALQDITDIIEILKAVQTKVRTIRNIDIKLPSEDVERIILALTNMADCDFDNGNSAEAEKSKRIANMLRTIIQKT